MIPAIVLVLMAAALFVGVLFITSNTTEILAICAVVGVIAYMMYK